MTRFALVLLAAAFSMPAWAHSDHPATNAQATTAPAPTAGSAAPAHDHGDMKGMDMKAMMDHCQKMMGQPASNDPKAQKMRRDCEAMMKSHTGAGAEGKPQGR